MNNGCITEHGTYSQLVSDAGEFARLDKAFGGLNHDKEVGSEGAGEGVAEDALFSTSLSQAITIDEVKPKSATVGRSGAGTGRFEGRLIVRTTTNSVCNGRCLLTPFR